MSDTMRSHTNIQTLSMPIWVYRISTTLKRIKRALEYAFGTLSADQAQDLLLECCYPAGWFPLLTLDVDETLSEARQKYHDHPELRGLIKAACARIGARWEDYNSALHEARAWAIECAEETARQNNIHLVALDDWQQAHDLNSQSCLEEAKSQPEVTNELARLSTQVLCLPAPSQKQDTPDEGGHQQEEGKQITLDEMLDILTVIKHPARETYQTIVEAVATLIARIIAENLGVNASNATFEGIDFGGTCSKFTPAFPGQRCPSPLTDYDPDVWCEPKDRG